MSQCDTCAFGKSGGAASESGNKLKGHICAMGGIPFHCHHTRSGADWDWKGDQSVINFLALPPGEKKLCEGWKRAVAERKRRGWFPSADFNLIRRLVAKQALLALDLFLDKTISLHKKEKAKKILDRCVRFLAHKDIGPEEIPL